MGLKLPGGFSPIEAAKQIGSYGSTAFGGTTRDYDVFSDYTSKGTDNVPSGNIRDRLDSMYPQSGSGPTRTAMPRVDNSGGTPEGARYLDSSGNINTFTNGQWVSTPTGGSSGGDATSAEQAAAQAVAEQAAEQAAARAAQVNAYNTSQANTNSKYGTQANQFGNQYQSDVNSFVRQFEGDQNEINQSAANNQLNLRTSMNDIVRGIQQGIRSGNVMLGGINAAGGGASEALARAYAMSGNRQAGEAQGQAFGVNQELQQQQGALNLYKDDSIDEFGRTRDQNVNQIRTEFDADLAKLDAESQMQGLDWRSNQGLVQSVVDKAMNRLAQIDQQKQQRLQGASALTPEQAMAEAVKLEQAGQRGNTFDVRGADVAMSGRGRPVGLPMGSRGRDEDNRFPVARQAMRTEDEERR